MQAYIDKTQGWHKNLSNVVVDGVTGITKPVSFDINESSTDANFLNEKNITVCLNYEGFRYWGSRTLSSDQRWAFQQATRTAQIIKETIAAAHLWAMDQPISKNLVKDILEGINNKFRQWTTQERILGGKAWVDEASTGDVLKDGKFLIKYDYHWMPSLESLGFTQIVNDEYVMDLANSITQL